MITFRQGNQKFNYRIVGVALQDGHVLLHQADGETFWTLPGGRGELGETAEQTLIREMREEIEADVEIIRLLWLVENFFNYEGSDYHELALYFLMRFTDSEKFNVQRQQFQGREANLTLTYRWFPLDRETLASLPLLPPFLQTQLQQLPETMQHIVQRDEYTWD